MTFSSAFGFASSAANCVVENFKFCIFTSFVGATCESKEKKRIKCKACFYDSRSIHTSLDSVAFTLANSHPAVSIASVTATTLSITSLAGVNFNGTLWSHVGTSWGDELIVSMLNDVLMVSLNPKLLAQRSCNIFRRFGHFTKLVENYRSDYFLNLLQILIFFM